jgi:hypothetical protein
MTERAIANIAARVGDAAMEQIAGQAANPPADPEVVPCPKCMGDGVLYAVCSNAVCDYSRRINPPSCALCAELHDKLSAARRRCDLLELENARMAESLAMLSKRVQRLMEAR